MKTKYPHSFTDALTEIKALRLRCEKAESDLGAAHARKIEHEKEKWAAQRETEEVRKNFADLKERLHNSEIQNARHEGYLDRVREDDAVSDPLIEIEGPEGKRMVSKRHPAPRFDREQYFGEMGMIGERRRHWTSY